MNGDRKDFTTLVSIMDRLRGPEGCPWDLKQDLTTLKKYMLEEVYECLDAIDRQDWDGLCEELGDVLLEVVFMAKIAEQEGHFNIGDSIEQVTTKLINRHPHIFGDATVKDAEEVIKRWHQIKMEEKNKSMAGILDQIPREMPALLRAYRLSERVSKIGFDWENVGQVLEKYKEEWDEFDQALKQKDRDRAEEELGDILFSLVNVGRFESINAEDALRRTCEKFIRRFGEVEQEMDRQGLPMQEAGIARLEAAWQKAKKVVG